MTIATLVSTKPEGGGGEGGDMDEKVALPSVMVEPPSIGFPYNQMLTAPPPTGPSWSWCGLVTSMIALVCCGPCGFVSTVASLLAYVDHKVRDFEGSGRKKRCAFWTATCAITLGCLALFIFIIVAAVSFPRLAEEYSFTVRESWSGFIEESDEVGNSSDWWQEAGSQLQDGLNLDDIAEIFGVFGNVTSGTARNRTRSGVATGNSKRENKRGDRNSRRVDNKRGDADQGKDKGGKKTKMESWMMDPMAEHDPSLHPLPKGYLDKWYKEHPTNKRYDDDDDDDGMADAEGWARAERRWRN